MGKATNSTKYLKDQINFGRSKIGLVALLCNFSFEAQPFMNNLHFLTKKGYFWFSFSSESNYCFAQICMQNNDHSLAVNAFQSSPFMGPNERMATLSDKNIKKLT